MSDFKLDPVTHDLLITDSSMSITDDDALESIAQRIKIRLMFFKGEWFLDENFGVPYFTEIFVKGVEKSDIDDIFRQQIVNTPGVVSLSEYSSSFDVSLRTLSISFKVITDNGIGEQITITI